MEPSEYYCVAWFSLIHFGFACPTFMPFEVAMCLIARMKYKKMLLLLAVMPLHDVFLLWPFVYLCHVRLLDVRVITSITPPRLTFGFQFHI